MATKEQIDWLKSQEFYADAVSVLGEYDDDVDYVGPKRSKILTWLVPRFILFFCDINVCAYIHDYWYAIGGGTLTRAERDSTFYGHIVMWIDQTTWIPAKNKYLKWVLNVIPRYVGRGHAMYYYMFTKLFGGKSFNYLNK
jgi:hypothetical protein